MSPFRMLLAAAVVAGMGAGCGSSPLVAGQQPASRRPATTAPGPTSTTPQPGGPAANRQKAEAEAARLLGLAVMPPGSVRASSGDQALLPDSTVGMPATTSLIDDHSFWNVPLSLTETLAWFTDHRPGGLALSGKGSSSTGGVTTSSGLTFSVPASAAWSNAAVEVSVAPVGPGLSVVRVDGLTVWINPVPLRDTASGARMRLSAGMPCPATDRGFAGVTNPPLGLDRSLLPAATPTGGLVCAYYGMNTHPFALKQATTLNATSAAAFAAKVKQLSLGHVDGAVSNCPMEDGSATVVALSYPNAQTVDLWIATAGCATVSNGYVSAGGSVLP